MGVSQGTHGGRQAGPFHRALVVEDEAPLREALSDHMVLRGLEVQACGRVSVAVQHAKVFQPDLLLLDFQLQEGTAIDLLTNLTGLEPWPQIIVISGRAGTTDAFKLAELGVYSYLPKPLTTALLDQALDAAARRPRDLTPQFKSCVGRVPVHQLQELLRDTMLKEALAKTGGNRSRAAELLGVSRQLLQHMLRTLRDKGSCHGAHQPDPG